MVFGINILLLPLLTVGLKGVTFGFWNYLPSGLAAVVFAALGVWTDEVPRLYRYRIITGKTPSSTPPGQRDGEGQSNSNEEAPGVTLSDKSTTYLLAAQLALSQFPYQLVPALVGWALGSAWVGELLPGGLNRWRVPAWVLGESRKRKERGQYEGLRRRLEEEGSSTDGMRNVSDRVADRQESGRRGFGRQIASYFTGS